MKDSDHVLHLHGPAQGLGVHTPVASLGSPRGGHPGTGRAGRLRQPPRAAPTRPCHLRGHGAALHSPASSPSIEPRPSTAGSIYYVTRIHLVQMTFVGLG